jgi:Leucine-rich repeat (LRR) protein
MSDELQLQAGGTLNSRRHLYIERQEDEKFFALLEQAEYVNVLSSRQMGKSSLMMRAVQRLNERGIKSVTIDLAAELGTPPDLDTFYLGLLSKIARVLKLQIDLEAWWKNRGAETVNQRLQRFFREIVGEAIAEPVVIFLDEIDSTLKLPYTDDLFTAIRGMYNDRPMVEVYRRITFCLLGVATPNELIKNRRTTAYNIGAPLTLRDFDRAVDDLSPFIAALNPNSDVATRLLDRILYWSGGQPYLTQKFCSDVVDNRIDDVASVDEFVTHVYENLGQASNDVHFQQILRFIEDRLSDEAATIELYAQVLSKAEVPDRTTLANAELKLSGLVKRDSSGNLVVRNPIYRRLFDHVWVQRTRPKRALTRARNYAAAASVAIVLLLGGSITYYVNVVRPNQSRLGTLDRLAALKISVTDDAGGVRAIFPNGATPELIKQAVPILQQLGPVVEIGYGNEPKDENGRKGFKGEMLDLSPLAELHQLRRLDISGLKVGDIGPLARLTLLEDLEIGYPRFSSQRERIPLENIAALANLRFLRELTIGSTSVSDLGPLASLAQLRSLDISRTDVSDLRPLAKLNSLESLYAVNSLIQSLAPLSESISLRVLALEGTKVGNLLPLSGLVNLMTLDLTDTSIADLSPLSKLAKMKRLYLDGTRVSDVQPLATLVNLETLWLTGTRVVDIAPLATLTKLTDLDLSETQIRDALPLQVLSNLRDLNLRNTKVPSEQLGMLRRILKQTNIDPNDPSVPRATNPSLRR